MDQHLIVYYCYLNLKMERSCSCSFVELLEGTRGVPMEGAPPVANQIDLFMHFLGASRDGLVARPVEMDKFSSSVATHLGHNVPALVNTHCIAYQKALYAGDGFKTITWFLILDQFAYKVYE